MHMFLNMCWKGHFHLSYLCLCMVSETGSALVLAMFLNGVKSGISTCPNHIRSDMSLILALALNGVRNDITTCLSYDTK